MDDKTLEKVRKLLAQAEGAGVTQAEAEAFTERAAEMMARHGIDAALVAERGTGQREQVESRRIRVVKPYATDKVTLLASLGTSLRCESVQTRNGRGVQDFTITVFGFPSDLDRVEMLFTSLLVQMTGQMVRLNPPAFEHAKTYRKSWMVGFIYGAVRKVRAAEARATADADAERGDAAGSTALVLRDRTVEVSSAVRDAYPRLGKARESGPVRGSGFRAGCAAGERADTGGARLDSGDRQAIAG